MTSGTFDSVAIDSITIDRTTRQRRELKRLDELAASIRNIGLINPPVIDREYNLIAGERRLEACRTLGWSDIPIQWADTLEPLELHLIELEENVRRVDLEWRDHNAAIAKYHALRVAADPAWTTALTSEALGVTAESINQHLRVAEARTVGVPGVEDAAEFSTARNVTTRFNERKKANAVNDVLDSIDVYAKQVRPRETAPNENDPNQEDRSQPPSRRSDLRHVDFEEWLKEDRKVRFNLLHCDFPYGIGAGTSTGQGGGKSSGYYSDRPEDYYHLLNLMSEHLNSFTAESAHLVFWFSMKYFEETKAILKGQGWKVDPFPFVWHKSDNAGILPDKDRGGRRTYETALLASRGDRMIVRPVALSFAGPTSKEHTSAKPKAVLEHLLRMFVDEHTLMLDPTAGSANALWVGEELGARYALGLERDADFYADAKENLKL